jgi:voltage-gated potassium channel Kch
VVYTELLDFDGDEMYIKQEKALEEKTFKDAVFAYETSSVMGLIRRDGKVMINPPMNTMIVPGDKLITITEDDDTAILSGKTSFNIDEQAIVTGVREDTKSERFLVLGWNDRAPVILRELDAYVVKGSEALILAEIDSVSDEIDAIAGSLSKLSVRFRIGDTTDRATLHDIDVLSFDTVILLGYGDRDVQIADADTLISLLHLRSISEKANIDIKIVSEMYDVRNRELAEVTKADDFIVSDKIISLMLSQLSENGRLKAVFDDLFSPEGSEIYLKPAGDYVKPGSTVDFYTVLESASRRHEVAIGYRVMKHEHNTNEQYGIVVNPVKSDKVTFCAEDKIIVLAES